MTPDHLARTLLFYHTYLETLGIHHLRNGMPLQHCAWMCLQALQYNSEKRTDKAMRWLGFIQGVLWSERIFSIDQLKEHSRATNDS